MTDGKTVLWGSHSALGNHVKSLHPCSFQEPVEDDEDDEADPNPPMMVPMGDMLNHTSNHNANLEYTPVRNMTG